MSNLVDLAQRSPSISGEEISTPSSSLETAKTSNEDLHSSIEAVNLFSQRPSAAKRCSSCGTLATPVWRRGGDAREHLLCNACSLRSRRSKAKVLNIKPVRASRKKKSAGDTTLPTEMSKTSPKVPESPHKEDYDLRPRLLAFMALEKLRLESGETSSNQQFMEPRMAHQRESSFEEDCGDYGKEYEISNPYHPSTPPQHYMARFHSVPALPIHGYKRPVIECYHPTYLSYHSYDQRLASVLYSRQYFSDHDLYL